MINNLFDMILIKPFGYILMSMYNITNSYGMSIILFSLLTRIILLPFSIKTKKNSIQSLKLQKKIKLIQLKHKNDLELQKKLIEDLYKSEGINIINSFIPIIFTLPIIFALFKVVQNPLKYILGLNHEVVNNIILKLGTYLSNKMPSSEIDLANIIYDNMPKFKEYLQLNHIVNFNFLGMNLLQTPSLTNMNSLLIIPILSGITTYLLQYITQIKKNKDINLIKSLNLIFPLFSVWIAFSLPASLGLYWIIGNVFNIIQEYIFLKKIDDSSNV